ncbi:MAG: hypothetical protein HQ495_00150 [Alphaproteobacteria bacterium]|nr:hypothetical protein [Alphaproteobacteria bacterium]
MRSLVFTMIVAAALGYLLFGEDLRGRALFSAVHLPPQINDEGPQQAAHVDAVPGAAGAAPAAAPAAQSPDQIDLPVAQSPDQVDLGRAESLGPVGPLAEAFDAASHPAFVPAALEGRPMPVERPTADADRAVTVVPAASADARVLRRLAEDLEISAGRVLGR